ncbi:hypothetical protein WJX73_005968 [Symbiochloris irregularis]|uniref:Tryptophan synthase beta chain-like PALP domain-containing protein n=1 Tax=Symbiochloris irregularis TaxID=706552 RepID=A0AAW1PVZ8_9CHLO
MKSAAVRVGGQQNEVYHLLQRPWLLTTPSTRRDWVPKPGSSSKTDQHLCILRDDLLHPLYGGNKSRKLDALIPSLVHSGVTDVVTCGGVQSAHTAAVAVACAEHNMRAHLLLRGEAPAVPAGNLLISRMFGLCTHVTRAEYADRQSMLRRYLESLDEAKTAVIHEGAASPVALLGLIRLVNWLADEPSTVDNQRHCNQPVTVVIDSGTGVTATGVALGIALLQLPWKVVGVMLAGNEAYYRNQQQELITSFMLEYGRPAGLQWPSSLPLTWVPRLTPRTFGKVLPGELRQCKQVAQEHGILLDPIYTLAAWEMGWHLLRDAAPTELVMILHTGGSLGLQGLAQRFPDSF